MGQDSRQVPQGSGPDAGQIEPGPLAEGGGPEPTVAHVHGGKPGEWRHGAYVLLGGELDGRHRLEQATRRLCEELARDQGYDAFAALPAARRGLTRRYAEVHVAASAMWASGVVTGRLADRWLDLASLQRRLGEALGLQRVLKSAHVPTLEEILRRDGEAVRP